MMTIILFDGECLLCQRSVQFIIKRDSKKHFQFASLQSDNGQQIIKQVNAPDSIDSLIVVQNHKYYTMSSAALLICKYLRGFWKLFYVLTIIPKPIRDIVYKFISGHRFKWFGKTDHCMMLSNEDKDRFL